MFKEIRPKRISEREIIDTVMTEAWPSSILQLTNRYKLSRALLEQLKIIEDKGTHRIELNSFPETRLMQIIIPADRDKGYENDIVLGKYLLYPLINQQQPCTSLTFTISQPLSLTHTLAHPHTTTHTICKPLTQSVNNPFTQPLTQSVNNPFTPPLTQSVNRRSHNHSHRRSPTESRFHTICKQPIHTATHTICKPLTY